MKHADKSELRYSPWSWSMTHDSVEKGIIYVEVDAQSFSELLPYTQRTLFALIFGWNSRSKPKHVVHDSL